EHRPARVDSLLEPDVWVEPKVVLTVLADEITRSPVHTCGKTDEEPGYALRFPRVVGWIREDKGPEDATTVKEILSMFQMQKRVQLSG
ncbi:MAG: DNA ligase, partial [Thermoflexus sp.]